MEELISVFASFFLLFSDNKKMTTSDKTVIPIARFKKRSIIFYPGIYDESTEAGRQNANKVRKCVMDLLQTNSLPFEAVDKIVGRSGATYHALVYSPKEGLVQFGETEPKFQIGLVLKEPWRSEQKAKPV